MTDAALAPVPPPATVARLDKGAAYRLTQDAERVAAVSLRFGAVKRATYHADGVTPETDTTHTVMLGLVAIQLAREYVRWRDGYARSAPLLDLGLVAELALVHDLPEAFCGDTNTLGATTADLSEKYQKEIRGRRELFDALPVGEVAHLTLRYERQNSPESRFVRYVDKILPKLTHALNDAEAIRERGWSLTKLKDAHDKQRRALAANYPDLAPFLDPIFFKACVAAEKAYQRGAGRFVAADTCGGV